MHLKEKIKTFNESKNPWVGSLRDFLFVITAVAIYVLVSWIGLGVWQPMVTVESESMVPHIQVGDIILIQGINRTQIITYDTGERTGYKSFDSYGDVILYKRCGSDGGTPIIHRAMYYIEKGDPMWDGGPPAPYAGYITKGDNNRGFDQQGNVCYGLPGKTSQNNPIKKEWVIGVARFYRVPLLGYISLVPRKILGL